MNIRIKQSVTMVYGLITIAVGIWRQLQTGDSPQAAWFGLVTGAIALGGAALLSRRNRLAGYVLVWLSLVFVGGWFLRRMLSGHPDGSSVRVIIILAMCAIEACILAVPGRRAVNSRQSARWRWPGRSERP